jgi:hypothetical protein
MVHGHRVDTGRTRSSRCLSAGCRVPLRRSVTGYLCVLSRLWAMHAATATDGGQRKCGTDRHQGATIQGRSGADTQLDTIWAQGLPVYECLQTAACQSGSPCSLYCSASAELLFCSSYPPRSPSVLHVSWTVAHRRASQSAMCRLDHHLAGPQRSSSRFAEMSAPTFNNMSSNLTFWATNNPQLRDLVAVRMYATLLILGSVYGGGPSFLHLLSGAFLFLTTWEHWRGANSGAFLCAGHVCLCGGRARPVPWLT